MSVWYTASREVVGEMKEDSVDARVEGEVDERSFRESKTRSFPIGYLIIAPRHVE